MTKSALDNMSKKLRKCKRERLSGSSHLSLRRLLTSRGKKPDCSPALGTTNLPSNQSTRSTRTISRLYSRQLSHVLLTQLLARIASRSCQQALGQEYQYLASTKQLLKLRPHQSKTRTCLRAMMRTLCQARVHIMQHKGVTSSLRPNHNVFNSLVQQSNASQKATNSSKMMKLDQAHTLKPSQLSRPNR